MIDIVFNIKKLNEEYNNLLLNFNSDNLYDKYLFDNENYYRPFIENILPSIRKELWNEKSTAKFDIYIQEVLEVHRPMFTSKLLKKNENNSDFLIKLSEDITADFNKLLISYKKMDESLKINFMNQFIKNKKNAFNLMVENDIDLFIKTVANLKNPKLQYYLINKIDESTTVKINTYIKNLTLHEKKQIADLCFFYPESIPPKEYINYWIGDASINIKFSRKILAEDYEEIKDFIKTKNKIYKHSISML